MSGSEVTSTGALPMNTLQQEPVCHRPTAEGFEKPTKLILRLLFAQRVLSHCPDEASDIKRFIIVQ